MKKQLSLLLTVLIANTAVLIGCGDAAKPADSTTAPSADTAVLSADTAADAADAMLVRDNLPDDLDFGGETITIHIRNGDGGNPLGNCVMEMTVESLTGEILNDAIYNRNLAVSERLNIKLDPYVSYDYTGYGTARKEILASISAGDDAYDIIAGWCQGEIASLILDGCFLELTDANYLDLSQPWWNQALAQSAPMGGKMYFVTGECNILTSLGSAYSVFVNEKIQNDYDIEPLAEAVLDGSWTIDKMAEITKIVQNDLNGDGKLDADNDRVGLVLLNYHPADAFYTSLDCHQIKIDDAGNLTYEPDGDRIQRAVERVYDLHYNNPGAIGWVENGVSRKVFADGRALMTMEFMEAAREEFRFMEDSYYIIPMPKLDEQQEQYYTYFYNNLTVLSVPVTNANTDATFATMEALCSESYNHVTPVFFEDCMQNKYARSETTMQMLELIRSTCYVDYEYVYGTFFNKPVNLFRDLIGSKSSDSASWIAKNTKSINRFIEKTLESFHG